jgi:hypothetical protein
MNNKQLIFVGGLHRSSTSLIHEILRSHPAIRGFANTGVLQDEGQHLQTVYPTAKVFGGAGRFGFNKASFMDEQHPLATSESAARLFQEWSNYWNTTKEYLIEKSPPNLVRTRFLQRIFPKSMFIIILRHPIAVAYATRKWSKTDIPSLIEHSLRCYERFREDIPVLSKVYILRYEEFVLEPKHHIRALLRWIGIEPFEFQHEVQPSINDKYFALWESDRHSPSKKLFGVFTVLFRRFKEFEKRANVFGYSIDTPENLLPIGCPGPHDNSLHRVP